MKVPFAAAAAFALLQLAAQPASASDYGCRVLMCMSNPAGPQAVAECQPPIQRFLMEQAQKPPKPFPTCEEGAPATMTPAQRPYDACPEGSTALAQDVKAVQMDPTVYANLVRAAAARVGNDRYAESRTLMGQVDPRALKVPSNVPLTILVGIGEGNDQRVGSGMNKVCTAKPLGTSLFDTGTDDNPQYTELKVYEQITTMGQAASPRVLDIRIGDQLLRSQRY